MNLLLHFGLLSLIVVYKVTSKPSCSSEKNLSKNKEETSCTNLGLSVFPLTDIPKNTAILILSFNNFKSLSTSSFKSFKDLTELDVSDNGMSSFEIDIPLMLEELNLANNTLKTLPMVSQLPGLTTLQLYNNHITTIPENAFKGLKKLTRLELQNNQIDSLDEEVFMDLKLLKHLDLSYNQLWHLPDRLLISVGDLEILHLAGNRLTEIPDNFFEDLVLSYVYLENNPWNCNCALQYFKNWLEEDEGRVYEISKEGPTKNQKSVVCSDGTPLIDYNMAYCLIKSKGDTDINSIPLYTKKSKMFITVVQTEPMTMPLWTSTRLAITELLKTEKPLTQLRTKKWRPTSAPTTVATTMLPTTILTTQRTTMLPTTIQTTQRTTMLPIIIQTTQRTTMLTTTTQTSTVLESTRTTEYLKTSPRTMVRSTPTLYPTLKMTTTKIPSTALLTTDIVSTTEAPSSYDRVKTSIMSPTDEPTEIPVNTMLPVRSSPVAKFGMDWLAKVIVEHCCLLHLIIYGLCIFFLLVAMIITTMCLLWIYCCNQDLLQWLPGIQLIRYSMRVSMSDEDILLVNNGAIESHFRDQSLAGITKMLVLESDTPHQELRYTSAIL